MKPIILLGIFLITISALAAEVINPDIDNYAGKGMKMLMIPVSPAMAAQGSTGAFHANDAFGFFAQPTAGLFNEKTVFSFSQTSWLVDTDIYHGGYTKRYSHSSFSTGFTYVDYGKMDRRDDTGLILGEFHPMDSDLLLNYAMEIQNNQILGATTHFLYEKLDTESSIGVACDLGYAYKTPFKGLTLGAAIRNIGTTSKMDEENIDLPLSTEIQFNYQKVLPSIVLNTEADLVMAQDDKARPAVGIEGVLFNVLKVRTGYMDKDAQDLTAGLGVNWKGMQIDYSWIHSDDLNNTQYIGVSYQWF